MKKMRVLAAVLVPMAIQFSLPVGAQSESAKVAQTKSPSTDLPAAPATNTPKGSAADDVQGAVKMARVFFVEPKDGATVPKTFTVKMGAEGIRIRPAGEAIDDMTSGHHHLIIDGKGAEAGQVVPADEKHIHFGKGQTEHTLTLTPGPHTLTLQFADGAHRSFGPKMSQTIKVKVQDKAR